MNSSVSELIVAVVTYVTTHDSYITKTKLLKLLYLFDVEFYRAFGRTFTGFQWKYFHLGPWTREFDPALEVLVSRGELIEQASERSEFEAKFLHASQPINLRRPVANYREEAVLKIVLDTWGASTTGEILDYVYFHTEPMENGIRNENLDFSKIVQQSPIRYKRTASDKTPGEIRMLRRKFGEAVAANLKSASFHFTPPQYDDEFREAIAKLDTGEV
jgi:hypothetical protein